MQKWEYVIFLNHILPKKIVNLMLLEGTAPGLANIGNISRDLSADDYTPTDPSQVIDQTATLVPQLISAGYSVNQMYQEHQVAVPRSGYGLLLDLGAFKKLNRESTGSNLDH